MLRRNPAFTMVVVLTLALGIGANTAIFSLIDAVMLRMLPVQKPEQLIVLKWASQSQPGTMPRFLRSLSGDADQDEKGRFASTSFSYPIFEDIQRGTANLYSGVLAFANADKLNLGVNGEAGLAVGQYISGDYFSTLGVPCALGRTIALADNALGANPVMVISYDYWTRRFGRDPSFVGKVITVNGIPFTLAGVAAREFYRIQPGSAIDVWIPLRTRPLVVPARPDDRNGEVSKFEDQGDWWVQIRRQTFGVLFWCKRNPETIGPWTDFRPLDWQNCAGHNSGVSAPLTKIARGYSPVSPGAPRPGSTRHGDC